MKFTPHKAVDRSDLQLSIKVGLYNAAGKQVGNTDFILYPKPGGLLAKKRIFYGGKACFGQQNLDDLAGFDFVLTTAVASGADMFQLESSSGQKITATMSTCPELAKWEEMVRTEAVSADLKLYTKTANLNDYFTTGYITMER